MKDDIVKTNIKIYSMFVYSQTLVTFSKYGSSRPGNTKHQKHNKIYLPSKDKFKKRNKGHCGLLSLLKLRKSCLQELFHDHHDHHLVARPRQELRTPLEGKKRERKGKYSEL